MLSCQTKSFNHPVEPLRSDLTLQAALFDSLAPLYPDTDVPSGAASFTTDIPRKAAGSVVVMVRPSSPDSVIDIRLEGDESADVKFHTMAAVPVRHNTGYFGMTESKIGFDHRNFVRHAPFEIFEVLEPAKPGSFGGEDVYAFFLKRRMGADENPGRRTIRITVTDTATGAVQRLTWHLEVHPTVLPEGPDKELLNTHWFNGPHEGFEERFDEAWWRLLEDQMAFRREGGQNVSWVPKYLMFDTVDGRDILNIDRLARYMDLGEKHGVLLFEGYMMARREKSFRSRRVVVGTPRYLAGTDEAAAYIRDTYGPLQDFLEERGASDRWVQHILDEPLGKQAPDYQWIAAELRTVMPGVRIIEATKTRAPLVGAVDIWNPLVSDYQKNRDFFLERREDGDEVWIYTCMVPGGPWVNRLMDQERLRGVYIGWGTAKFDIGGYLRWGFDQWRRDQDIWNGDLSTTWSGRIHLPQGDEFVVFPGPEGTLISTTRWEAGRLGREDYRLLMTLKEVNPAAFDEVIALCFTDFKTYETDPAVYREARRRLLEYLD